MTVASVQLVQPKTKVVGGHARLANGGIPSRGFRKARFNSAKAGFSLVEVIVSLGLLTMTLVAAVQAMLVTNRLAATNRISTAARAIVQRNVDTALSLRFDSTITPAILALTAGTAYDDDGGGDNSVNILTEKDANGNPLAVVKGTLSRKVTAVANTMSADVRRIEFRLSYTFQNRPYVVSMSTVRTIDD